MLLRYFFLFFGIFAVLHALRVKDSIGIQLTSVTNNCMRLLNGTNQIGCQSSHNGNTGVVTIVRRADDIQRHLELLPWGLDQLIALVNVKNLNGNLLAELKDNTNVVGILLYRNRTEQFGGFSEDATCPNRAFSFYNESVQCQWNDAALFPDGSFFTEYNKPVFIMQNLTEISLLLNDCYHSYNRPIDSSGTNNYRCVAKVSSFMLAAGDGRLCQNRQKTISLTSQNHGLCDELVDYNVIQVLPAIDANVAKANIAVIATRMDSFSLFSQSRGSDTSVLVSLISSLSIARSIGRNRLAFERMSRETKKQLMFAFFHIESLNYIGSSRFVYDLQQPPEKLQYKPDKTAKWLQMDDLGVFVELQQFAANHSSYFLHNDWNVAKEFGPEMEFLHKSAKEGARQVADIEVNPLYAHPDAKLPPASYHSFLKARKIPGAVLSPFRKRYDTKTLNSFFDTQLSEQDPNKMRNSILRDVEASANIAMRIGLDHVSKNDPEFAGKFSFDKEFATTLIDCFIFDPNWNCSFFDGLLRNASLPRFTPHMAYVDIGGASFIRIVVKAILVYALGDTNAALNIRHYSECLAKNKNQDLYRYYWQNDPDTDQFHCYQASTYLRLASSPAMEIEDYDLSNKTYPVWFESRWKAIKLEVFLDAGYKFEIHAFGLALVVVAASIVLYCFLDETWFINPGDVMPADV